MSGFWIPVLSWHREAGSPLAELELRPVAPDQVEAELLGRGLHAATELVEYHAFGVDIPADRPSYLYNVFDGFRYPGIRYLSDELTIHRGELVIRDAPPWRSDWFPLLKDRSSNLLVYGTADGSVWHYSGITDDLTLRVGDSLASFAQRLVDVLDAAAYRWDPDYGLVADRDVDFVEALSAR